ncbi:MAG: F0F1 ATP synthase subunit epsilon [Deltaproteobacteria bacterium]|jgi:F-type H+-transporting ATPase subunit epsilon|nr:F0F1 ATP synthase subunit epsilon [Deltaproteobacteria bacterium]
MAANFLLEVVTPHRLVASQEVDEITAPGAEGEFGVLPGHTPFFTTLKVGEVMFRAGKEERHMAVTWGFVEVLPDRVTILTEAAELAPEIDVERAKRAKDRAEKQLKQLRHEDKEFYSSMGALERAMNRLTVASRRR